MRRISAMAVGASLLTALAGPMAGAATAAPSGVAGLTRLSLQQQGGPLVPHGSTSAARELMSRGYLVPNPAAYDRAKARLAQAARPAGHPGAVPAEIAGPTSTNPKVVKGWNGQYDPTATPPDATGAIGTTRVVEVLNQKVGVYSRTGGTYTSGTLASLTWDWNGKLTSPQVIWDPATSRFYYSVLNFTNNLLDVGFSTTSSPTSQYDWCHLQIDFGYGASLPAFPRLGDTLDSLLIGVSVFDPTGAFVRSDLDWVSKPPAGTTTCPDPSTYRFGAQTGLTNVDGTPMLTPVPVVQTDPSTGGWVVGARDVTGGPAADLSVLAVTEKQDGTPDVQTSASSITVPQYALPPPAIQRGTTFLLDTLDGRLTQAVSAIDPASGSVTAVWTQHTVQSALGLSEVRWYEIDPAALSVLQSGAASSSTMYVFNGAIAPDRLVNGTTAKFGDSMVLNFNTSSSTVYPKIQMVSKRGPAAVQSPFISVQSSGGKNVDSTCTPVCRWGDYAGAASDPAAPVTGLHGQVLGVNEYNASSHTDLDVDSRTRIFLTAP